MFVHKRSVHWSDKLVIHYGPMLIIDRERTANVNCIYNKNDVEEDTSVRDFLQVTSIAEAFHLPLSPQAHAEVRELQTISTYIQPMTSNSDVWHNTWGKTEYKSTDYYQFFF